jgi:hypothetical protein
MDESGDTTGIDFKLRVESDNADSPSGTVLGATNNAITAVQAFTSDGFVSQSNGNVMPALTENTGNLTVNTPVWIIFYRSGGASLSGTNFIQTRGFSAPAIQQRAKLYSATWGAAQVQRFGCVVQHADGTYAGLPHAITSSSPSVATDIYDNYKHALRFKFGAKTRIVGLYGLFIKNASPNNLVISVYEESTLKYATEIAASDITTAIFHPWWFPSPVHVAADTNIYIVLCQPNTNGDGTCGTTGGTDSNDYDSRVHILASSTYRAAAMTTDTSFCYGTSSDPTALTCSNDNVPMMWALVSNTATDLDQAAGGAFTFVQ